jgi:hypothetical protein
MSLLAAIAATLVLSASSRELTDFDSSQSVTIAQHKTISIIVIPKYN